VAWLCQLLDGAIGRGRIVHDRQRVEVPMIGDARNFGVSEGT
jgi:hypothetical protein